VFAWSWMLVTAMTPHALITFRNAMTTFRTPGPVVNNNNIIELSTSTKGASENVDPEPRRIAKLPFRRWQRIVHRGSLAQIHCSTPDRRLNHVPDRYHCHHLNHHSDESAYSGGAGAGAGRLTLD
jgi:hypothetical protein